MLQTLKHHEHKITITSYLVRIIFKETEEVRELEHRNFYISHILLNSFFRQVHFCDYTLSSSSWQLLWVHLRDSKGIYLKFSFPICQEKGKSCLYAVSVSGSWTRNTENTHTQTHTHAQYTYVYIHIIYISVFTYLCYEIKKPSQSRI